MPDHTPIDPDIPLAQQGYWNKDNNIDSLEFKSNSDIPAVIRNKQMEEYGETLKLVPGKPDKELAEEIRQRVIAVIDPLLAEMSAAKKQGFDVLLGIQTDAQGKSFLSSLKIAKEF